MSTAEIDLASGALRLIGELSVTGLDEGTDLAETVNRVMPATVRACLTAHPWRHTLRKVQLARLTTPPLNEWTYAHALPAEKLQVRAMFPSGSPRATPLREYEIFDNRAYSHALDLWCDYQVETPPGAWPPYLYALIRAALASDFAVAVGTSTTLAEMWHRRAFGTPSENLKGGLMGQATRLDSQQQPPQQVTDEPLMAARFGGYPGRRW